MAFQQLYWHRNWYRLTALLQGLKRVGTIYMPELINSDGNYSACRALMNRSPGLPFLLPYVKEYFDQEDGVMARVFSFTSYRMDAMQEDQELLHAYKDQLYPI